VILAFAALLMAQGQTLSAVDREAVREEVRARVSRIEALLEAMARQDQRAFKALKGGTIAFSSTPDDSFVSKIGPNTPRLALNSLQEFASCSASAPRMTGIDWYSVIWDCPDDGPIADTQFSFKFSGASLLAIQKSHLPPRIMVRTNG
jgi:hypothetical protein